MSTYRNLISNLKCSGGCYEVDSFCHLLLDYYIGLFWIISIKFHSTVSPLNQTVSRNDCNFKKLLIVGQILSQSSIGNIEGIVQRTCILISGCKGWSKTWDNYYFLLHVIISRCHWQSKEGQAYSDSFKGKKRFLTLWNWNSHIESICLKFDSWLFAICKPQQPSSNKWPWTEQLKCYILKLIVIILPKKIKSLSSSNSLSCMYSSRCMLCVCFLFLPDVICKAALDMINV